MLMPPDELAKVDVAAPLAAFTFVFQPDLNQVAVRGPGIDGTVYTRAGDGCGNWLSPLGEYFPQPAALEMMRAACQAAEAE